MRHHDHHDVPAPVGPLNGLGRQTRREFLRRFGLMAGAGAAAPFAMQLGALAPAAAANAASGDYRALVCVFLYGGNDQWNTFVPDDDAGYATYAAARPGLAHARGDVLAISPDGGFDGNGSFGFAPQLPRLHQRFGAGDVAVVANVGTLLAPTTKNEYDNGVNLPPQLFSHNDQQSFWQSGSAEGATTGWGGRIADYLLSANGDNDLFTSISASGNAVMMSGRSAVQYQVSSRGVTTVRDDVFASDSILAGLRDVMAQPRGGLYSSAYSAVSRRAIDAADQLSAELTTATQANDLSNFFRHTNTSGPAQNLLGQLEVVANLILAGRGGLGLKRQVFFVGLGGFDNHSRLIADHSQLLTALDLGLSSFNDALNAAGAGNQVTTFTASDFGRSLVSNGDGTDHGWGGHHFVMGGAVQGNRVIGDIPEVADGGSDDVGRGRLLPSTSVDEYAGTFARWLGVEETQLADIAPNLANFNQRDLGLF